MPVHTNNTNNGTKRLGNALLAGGFSYLIQQINGRLIFNATPKRTNSVALIFAGISFALVLAGAGMKPENGNAQVDVA